MVILREAIRFPFFLKKNRSIQMGKSAILKKIHIATLNYNKLKKAPNLLDGIPFEQAGVF